MFCLRQLPVMGFWKTAGIHFEYLAGKRDSSAVFGMKIAEISRAAVYQTAFDPNDKLNYRNRGFIFILKSWKSK